MKIIKIGAVLLAALMLFCTPATMVFASESEKPYEGVEVLQSFITSNHYQIYTDRKTKVYTGRGIDCWLHVSPSYNPLGMRIYMYDYNDKIIWYSKPFFGTDTTYWFVGSNIKYVCLQGGPGDTIVTATKN